MRYVAFRYSHLTMSFLSTLRCYVGNGDRSSLGDNQSLIEVIHGLSTVTDVDDLE